MKKQLGILVFCGAAAVGWAEESFSHRITRGEFLRAGLDRLTPAELAQLDTLFKKYSAGEITDPVPSPVASPAPSAATPVVRKALTPAPAPNPAPSPAATVAPAIVPAVASTPAPRVALRSATEPPVPAAAEPARSGDGFFAKMKKSLASSGSKKSDEPAIETEVDGDFRGWGQRTVWTLKDGTVWRVDNLPQPYFTTVTPNPRVRITRAILGGYWMEFVDLDLKVRVQQVK